MEERFQGSIGSRIVSGDGVFVELYCQELNG